MTVNHRVVGSSPTKPKNMEQTLNNKIYRIKKIKTYIKKNKFFIFYNGTNKNSNDWLLVKQELKKLNFEFYKIFNKAIDINLKNSLYFNISSRISAVMFLSRPQRVQSNLSKKAVTNKFEKKNFITALKLNNKLYSANQVKQINSLNYKSNLLLLFNYLAINTKFSYKKIKSK